MTSRCTRHRPLKHHLVATRSMPCNLSIPPASLRRHQRPLRSIAFRRCRSHTPAPCLRRMSAPGSIYGGPLASVSRANSESETAICRQRHQEKSLILPSPRRSSAAFGARLVGDRRIGAITSLASRGKSITPICRYRAARNARGFPHSGHRRAEHRSPALARRKAIATEEPPPGLARSGSYPFIA